MATAKQVYYSPPQALLPKRRNSGSGRSTTLTVAIPFSFSTRLSRRDKALRSAASIRRSQAVSLPRLTQQSARPSLATSRSTTTNSGSVVKKAASGCETSLVSAADPRSTVETGASETEAEEVKEVLSPEEEEERRQTKEKCVKWLQGLPGKFSGMHIVQQTIYTAHR